MNRLFLASSFSPMVGKFRSWLEEPCAGKTVTFIPTASIHEKVTFYVDTGRKALEKSGINIDELEISTASHKDIARKLQTNDYIYVSGGNTFFLLQELKRTGADKLIIDQINSGKHYIGESAGAMVVSPNIEYVKDMDDCKEAPDLQNYDALHIIDFYPLPHYTNFPFKKAVEKIIAKYDRQIKLYPISNSQAIVVNDNKIEILKK